MTSGVATMGRPRRGAKKPAVRKPDGRVAVIHLKGTVEYADWLEKAHRKTHIPKAAIVRLAIEDWAKKNGLPEPPEL